MGYRHQGQPPGEHLGLPSPYLTMVITLDGPLVVTEHPDPHQPPGRFDTLVGGLHTRPARMIHPGHQAGIQLSLTPLGARALLGMPAAELVSTDVPLEDVPGTTGLEVTERIREARGWRARFDGLKRVLLRGARRNGDPRPSLLAHIAEQASAAQRLRDAIDRERTRVAAMRRALLEAAFSGRLTGSTSDGEVVQELAGAVS